MTAISARMDHHTSVIAVTLALLVQVALSRQNTTYNDDIVILLNNINSTTESSSNAIDSIADSISHITASAEYSNALQALLNKSLSDIKVTLPT